MMHPTPEQRDERVSLPLDEETALRALLAVDPDSEPMGQPHDAKEPPPTGGGGSYR